MGEPDSDLLSVTPFSRSRPSLLALCILFPPLDTSSLQEELAWPESPAGPTSTQRSGRAPSNLSLQIGLAMNNFSSSCKMYLFFLLKVSQMFLEHVPQPETALLFYSSRHCWRDHDFWYSYLEKNALWSGEFKANIFHIITQSPICTLATSSSRSFLDNNWTQWYSKTWHVIENSLKQIGRKCICDQNDPKA